jgi:hypothetical protein
MTTPLKKTVKAPKLAMRLQARLRELGMNPRQLSAEIQQAYDHVRKVYNGDVFPGPHTLKTLCDYLDLDYEEMDKLVKQDRAMDRGWESAVTNKSKTLLKVERLWQELTPYDEEEILTLVTMKANLNIARGSKK